MGRYWGQRLGEVQVGKVLLDMLGILRRHRVRVNPTFTIVNIAIAVTEGIGKQLDPELDLMARPCPISSPTPSTPGRPRRELVTICPGLTAMHSGRLMPCGESA